MIRTALYIVSLVLLALPACRSNQANEIIPTGPVNLTIDLNLPANSVLLGPGGFAYYEGGVRGVLVIHDYDDEWYAFERTCAWEPLNACSKIWIDTVAIQMKCGNYVRDTFQACCPSRYIFNGMPVKGPARGILARYKISRTGNLLYVYN
jgi:hypothetical protein